MEIGDTMYQVQLLALPVKRIAQGVLEVEVGGLEAVRVARTESSPAMLMPTEEDTAVCCRASAASFHARSRRPS